jgi:glycosyltransferase involved in cell wall biosynthesis
MKILVITSTYARWENDTEPRFVDNLCQYLAKDSEVHVLAPHAPGTKTRERVGDVDVFRFRYCLQGWETLAYDGGILPNLKQDKLKLLLVPLFILGQLLLAIKLLRKHNYDVIHAHWIIPQGLVAALARPFAKTRPAIVMTSHGGNLFALKGTLLSNIKRWITGKAEKLTVVSSAMKTKASRLGLKAEHDTAVIPMGVDSYDIFKPPGPEIERRGLLFVGRLVDKKGIEYLLQAMPTVLAAFPDETLTIIGDGPLKEQLEELCKNTGIERQVKFLGPVVNEEIPVFLQHSAVTVFPSIVTDSGDQEGTPVAIMEALACECATVVSDYPGARDIISHGETGLLVAERDSQAIAEQIILLLRNPNMRDTLGANARSCVQDSYDWRVISAAFTTVFRSLPTT